MHIYLQHLNKTFIVSHMLEKHILISFSIPVIMDVVICGGGIIGCSIAYHLAKKGVKSTILECTDIACAASGKAGKCKLEFGLTGPLIILPLWYGLYG